MAAKRSFPSDPLRHKDARVSFKDSETSDWTRDEAIPAGANLSRFSQAVKPEPARCAGHIPTGGFGGSDSPRIAAPAAPPELKLDRSSWPKLLDAPERAALEKVLPDYVRERRWFGGKARKIRRIRLSGHLPLTESGLELTFIEIRYVHGPPETYILPLGWSDGEAAAETAKTVPGGAVARLELSGRSGILYDAVHDPAFRTAFLKLFFGRRRIPAGSEALVIEQNRPLLKAAPAKDGLALESHVIKAEQTNTSIIYGSAYFAKLYRRLEEGLNPDMEIGRRLTEGAAFSALPPYMGAVTLHRGGKFYGVIGLLQGYVASQGDSWTYALEQVARYYGKVLSRLKDLGAPPQPPDPFKVDPGNIPQRFTELIGGPCLEMMSLLGRRTAEMHLALQSAGNDPDFAPEPFTRLYQRSVCRSMLGLTVRTMRALSRRLSELPENVRAGAAAALEMQPRLIKTMRAITGKNIPAGKIRIHGDYHLGQVLFTGKDFVVLDFEGEPARPLGERRLKGSALRDIAGMMRSFHYAALAPFFLQKNFTPENRKILEPWADLWHAHVAGVFLRSYLRTAGQAGFLPRDEGKTAALLRIFLLEKAVYELGYELNNRPDWVSIPLKGLLSFTAKAGTPEPDDAGADPRASW